VHFCWRALVRGGPKLSASAVGAGALKCGRKGLERALCLVWFELQAKAGARKYLAGEVVDEHVSFRPAGGDVGQPWFTGWT